MAVLFLLLAFLTVVLLAAAGLENSSTSSATLFDRSFNQLTEGRRVPVPGIRGLQVKTHPSQGAQVPPSRRREPGRRAGA